MFKKICTIVSAVFVCACASSTAKEPVKIHELNGYALEFDSTSQVVSEMTGPVMPMEGSASEIIAKAQLCVPRSISNYATRTQTFAERFSGGVRQSAPINVQVNDQPLNPLIELVDRDNGQLVANSRATFDRYIVRAKLILQAKNGRFRIIQRDLGFGSGDSQSSFEPVVFDNDDWTQVLSALQHGSDKLAACMVEAKSENW